MSATTVQTRWLAALGACLVAVAIGWLVQLPEQSRSLLRTHGALHPYVHVAIFACLMYLATRAARSLPMTIILFTAAVAFGCATELAESQRFGSPLEYSDMMLDAGGALLGSTLGLLLSRRTKARREGRWE